MSVTGKSDILILYQRIVSDLLGLQRWCQLSDAQQQRLDFYQGLIAVHGNNQQRHSSLQDKTLGRLKNTGAGDADPHHDMASPDL